MRTTTTYSRSCRFFFFFPPSAFFTFSHNSENKLQVPFFDFEMIFFFFLFGNLQVLPHDLRHTLLNDARRSQLLEVMLCLYKFLHLSTQGNYLRWVAELNVLEHTPVIKFNFFTGDLGFGKAAASILLWLFLETANSRH